MARESPRRFICSNAGSKHEGLKVYFSEWNSSELVKSATSKGKKRELLTPTTFSLIHATDFADRYERHLVPLLRAGYVVLCDRYIFTAFAPRRGARLPARMGARHLQLCRAAGSDIFLQGRPGGLARAHSRRPAAIEVSSKREWICGSPADPYESFRIFQGRILEQYLAMSTEFNFLVIDANQLVEKQQALVRQLVSQRVELSHFATRATAAAPAADAAQPPPGRSTEDEPAE